MDIGYCVSLTVLIGGFLTAYIDNVFERMIDNFINRKENT